MPTRKARHHHGPSTIATATMIIEVTQVTAEATEEGVKLVAEAAAARGVVSGEPE